MLLGLDERPRATDGLVQLRVGEGASAVDRGCPSGIERVQRGAQAGDVGRAQHAAQRIPRVVLVDVGGDIDPVDDEPVDQPVDVDEPDVLHPCTGQVDVAQRRLRQIDAPEDRLAEILSLELLGHHISSPSRVRHPAGDVHSAAWVPGFRRGHSQLTRPVAACDRGSGGRATLEWGQRVLVDGHAQVARISVTPWSDGEANVNPRIGIDPEVAEWSEPNFWSEARSSARLTMIQILFAAEMAAPEYDCTGSHRNMSRALADRFREVTRDWRTWHRAYDDPTSDLSRRLNEIVDAIHSAIDSAPPGPLRLISLCCGDAPDVTRALTDHPRRSDVTGCLIELDSQLAATASANLRSIGSGLVVRCGDASDPKLFADMAPADVLLLVGIFGNITDTDVERVISSVPTICKQGATVIWTRHRRDPDLTPKIAHWFATAGCVSSTFRSPGRGSYAVGSERCEHATPLALLPDRLFTFRDDLW